MKVLKSRLLTPGPTMVPERVLEAISRPTLYHRSPDFQEVMLETQKRLKRLFKTDNDTLILSSSGTGAMDAAVSNLLNPGDKAIVIVGGKFGERWVEICETYGVKVVPINIEWGKAPDIETVRKTLDENRDAKALLTQICETSTGTIYDVRSMGKLLKNYPDTLLIADGITAFGVYNIPIDEWNIDVAITGSQKALMSPPGIAIISLNEKAKERMKSVKPRSYYFNLTKELKSQLKGQTAYTTAVNLVVGLNEALRMMDEEGIKNVFKRHEILAESARNGIRAIGLKLLSSNPANGLTAVKCPEGVNGQDLVKTIRENYGITIAGGQSKLKGKIFRLSHMGYVDIFDIISGLASIELGLELLGYRKFQEGSSIKAAMDTFRNLTK